MSPLVRAAVLFSAVFLLCPFNAAAFDRGEVQKFATLPTGSPNPEGITTDEHGNVYVSTFAVPPRSSEGQVFVFGRNGDLQREVSVQGASSQLLGLDFHPYTRELLVIDFGGGTVFKVNPFSGASSPFFTGGPIAGSGLNALTFDKQGRVYVSDSFGGIIWRTGQNGGVPEKWCESSLLRPLGTPPTGATPPFGANGVAFNKNGSALFVANTGDDRVILIPVFADDATCAPEIFVNSINGADGLIIDRDDNIWVAANQSDEIVMLDKTGKVIAKLGDFDGIDRHDAAVGFLFPASLARHDGWIYVTDLALDLRLFGLP